MQVNAYVESGVAMAYDPGVAAWVFDVEFWGLCGQGRTESEALENLGVTLPSDAELVVVERIVGDERAFGSDDVPATEAEVERTQEVLTEARAELLENLQGAAEEDLDRSIPQSAHFAPAGPRSANAHGISPTRRAATICPRWACRPNPGPRTW